jgi:hypothetical protein
MSGSIPYCLIPSNPWEKVSKCQLTAEQLLCWDMVHNGDKPEAKFQNHHCSTDLCGNKKLWPLLLTKGGCTRKDCWERSSNSSEQKKCLAGPNSVLGHLLSQQKLQAKIWSHVCAEGTYQPWHRVIHTHCCFSTNSWIPVTDIRLQFLQHGLGRNWCCHAYESSFCFLTHKTLVLGWFQQKLKQLQRHTNHLSDLHKWSYYSGALFIGLASIIYLALKRVEVQELQEPQFYREL